MIGRARRDFIAGEGGVDGLAIRQQQTAYMRGVEECCSVVAAIRRVIASSAAEDPGIAGKQN